MERKRIKGSILLGAYDKYPRMIINAAQKHKRPYRQNLSVRKGAFFAFIYIFYVKMPFVF